MLGKKIKRVLFNKRWRKRNGHNYTFMCNIFNIDKVHVGKKTYGGLTVYMHNEINTLVIGNYCSIGPNTQFILSADHRMDTISTYPFKAKILGEKDEGCSKGDIILGDDVWIGAGAIILSGVHIGQGAVIAAGAVVNKDVPSYSIVGGVPAKLVRYKFRDEIIEELLKIDFSKLSEENIKKNSDLLYEGLTPDNYKQIIEKICN